MELPFLKNKNKNAGGGGIERVAAPTHEDNMDNGLMDQVCDELFQAVETKDKKMFREALTALVLHVQDMDAEQDEAEDMEG